MREVQTSLEIEIVIDLVITYGEVFKTSVDERYTLQSAVGRGEKIVGERQSRM